MLYFPELAYLQDQPQFPLHQAVRVTAATVARWCTHYEAKLISANRKIEPIKQEGQLPSEPAAREEFVAALVGWLMENSITEVLFYLVMDDQPVPQSGRIAKFDHHDDTDCWVLNLSESEFAVLQSAWRSHGLPEDLFYPEGSAIRVPYPASGWKGKLLRLLGVQKCYTPKQWQKENHEINQ